MIALGSDHGGFSMKEAVKRHLLEKGYEVFDCGVLDGHEVDYPDVADLVCAKIQQGDAGLGILICGTGIGMSIAAYKHAGIRAALCSDTFSARMAREHNDANVLPWWAHPGREPCPGNSGCVSWWSLCRGEAPEACGPPE